MPGDEPYFGQESPLWRIHRERVVRLSAPRALLLQASHPLVWAGLLDYGRALEEAHERLNRTAQAMGIAAFGSRNHADRVGRRVRGIHRHTRGKLERDAGRLAAGTPYAADDPALLLWVLAAIADSALVVHHWCVRSLTRDERDGLWQDYRGLGAIFGLDPQHTPETIEDFETYMAGMVTGGELHVSSDARTLATDAALRPRVAARRRPLVGLIGFVTVGLLPPRLRRQYRLSWGPSRGGLLAVGAWCARRIVVPLLPDRVRFVGQRHSLPETRPVLVGDLRRDGEVLLVVSKALELRVEGEPELARRVLALCDGKRPLREIVEQLDEPDAQEDVYELVRVLVEQGALRNRGAT